VDANDVIVEIECHDVTAYFLHRRKGGHRPARAGLAAPNPQIGRCD